MPQEVEIFDLSIRDNILLGQEVNMDKLERMYEICQLTDWIGKLTDGDETLVGARGIRLSGGERQRIGLARALYKDAAIYIFDESTSQLDSIIESEILAQVRDYLTTKTVITVAHRLATIASCDTIYVFEHGTIVERGGWQALMDLRGRFHAYWERQAI